MWFAAMNSSIILMEDVFTVHSKSVGVDEKNVFLELNNIIESPFVTTINISRVAHTK